MPDAAFQRPLRLRAALTPKGAHALAVAIAEGHPRSLADATVYQYGLAIRRWAAFVDERRGDRSLIAALMNPDPAWSSAYGAAAPCAPATRYADKSAIRAFYRMLRARGLSRAVPFPDFGPRA